MIRAQGSRVQMKEDNCRGGRLAARIVFSSDVNYAMNMVGHNDILVMDDFIANAF